MRLPVGLALLLLASMLPLPPASAQETWSVDALVSVRTATSADYTWKITGLRNTNLTLPLPDNATFLEAYDDAGARLESGVVREEVWVVSKASPFTLRFRVAGELDGPFSVFPAQVASAADSPVTVGIETPPGWGVVGWRNNDPDAPRDTLGRFHHTGPAYVQWLVLEAGVEDPGPDPTVSGRAVRREGQAMVDEDAIRWTLTTTYDTDVYSRSWEVHLPEGATVLAATTPVGPAQTRQDGELLHVTTPYPVGFGLGGRTFTVEMRLPAPEGFGGAFQQANLSVRAADGDRVRVNVTLAPGIRYAGTQVAGGHEPEPLRYVATGPLSVTVAFLPPPEPGHVQFSEGLFVVDAPEAFATAARATARNASELLPRVAPFAYGTSERPFHVSYTTAPIFGWEQGFYSNGLNTISIRASTLENATSGEPRLVPVGVLVHEATHGLLDRRMPDAPSDLSALHEGVARLAEAGIEPHFPEEEVMECTDGSLLTASRCTIHSARPTAEDVQRYHQAGSTFPLSWSAEAVPDAERGFLYDYSGLVFRAFHERAPPGALENTLLTLARTTFAGDPEADARTLLDTLLANAPGTSAQALLYPGREAASLPEGQFHACMGDLVAPPYPWDESDVRTPPGGCPATGYGPRGAELPPPPPPPPSPSPVEEPTPVTPSRPPPLILVTTMPPASGATPPPAPPGEATPDGEAPGSLVSPPGSTPPAIPGAPLGALVLALAVGALVARRRA